MFTHLPVDAKRAGSQTTGVKRNGLANSIKTPKKNQLRFKKDEKEVV